MNILQLPTEVIELIIGNARLEDVISFSATCTHFHEVVIHSNFIWKCKYLQKWPDIAQQLPTDFQDWYTEIRSIYHLESITRKTLSSMSPRFYAKHELSESDFEDWKKLIYNGPRNYYYLVKDLIGICNTITPIQSIEVVPIVTDGNKTLRYYSLRVLRFIRQHFLTIEWKTYMQLPERNRVLERGASIIAQWCQPDKYVDWMTISQRLDVITEDVRQHLREVEPNHPLFTVDKETLMKWRGENLEDNIWDKARSMQIIDAIKLILCEVHGFCGNVSDYYMPQNSYINEVLDNKCGLPVTLAIIYESVARRMGVNCEPLNIPAHFLLRYADRGSGSTFYIDVFNKGSAYSVGCTHLHKTAVLARPTAHEVMERMANNLEISLRRHIQESSGVTQLRSILELLLVISPNDFSVMVNLSRLYMMYDMDTTGLERAINEPGHIVEEPVQNILNMLRNYTLHKQLDTLPSTPLRRTDVIKYAVGMVMQHNKLNYKCVITDWTHVCTASVEWQKQMNVHETEFKNFQPFYNVLVEDNSKRYVAQENLTPTIDTGFLYLNEDIGKHFSHFFETHYVPNEEKEKEYPDDKKVRQHYHMNMLYAKYDRDKKF